MKISLLKRINFCLNENYLEGEVRGKRRKRENSSA
jgi:hypothetical protein